MKKICYLLLALTLLVLPACKKDELNPQTGDLKIVLSGSFSGIAYALYTEGSRASLVSIPPLREGRFTSSTVLIRDLNQGNYVLSVGGSTKSVQVTAGREREYKFQF
jgi:hypothetical protein